MKSKDSYKFDSFYTKYFLSCVAATIAESVTYPLDFIKTRMQIYGEMNSVKGRYPGMMRTGINVVKEEGFFKLWQGVTPALYRHYVYSGCRLCFYEWIRENLFGKNKDGTFPLWKAVAAGMTAGSLAQFLASPTDLIKVLMQAEGKRKLEGKTPRVTSASGALRHVIQSAGILGLWRGCVPNVQRAALVNLGDLTTYDYVKHILLNRTNLKDNMVTHSLSSICSGLVAATLGTPADLVKTRMMNQSHEGGRGVLYSSSVDCLLKTIKNEGFLALYKGFIPIWARMAPWSITFWLSYEQIRRLFGASSF